MCPITVPGYWSKVFTFDLMSMRRYYIKEISYLPSNFKMISINKIRIKAVINLYRISNIKTKWEFSAQRCIGREKTNN